MFQKVTKKLSSVFCWSAKEKAHLGLGTVLYLNALRWLLLIFFVIFILSIPNLVINAKGPRYTLSSLNGDFLAFASTHLSIANLGSQEWTPITPLSCNNNGFAAKVCKSWSSSTVSNEYDYPCETNRVKPPPQESLLHQQTPSAADPTSPRSFTTTHTLTTHCIP